MWVIGIVLGVVVLVQMGLIWAMINRILVQAGARSIAIPDRLTKKTDEPPAAASKGRKLYTVPIDS